MYIADKIRGGLALKRYRTSNETTSQDEAIKHLKNALSHWKDYADSMEKYNVQVMPHQFDKEFSFRKHIKSAELDIELAKK